MGYGVLSVVSGDMVLLEMNVLRIPARLDTYERLHLIHKKITALVREFSPTEFAIEAPFFGKNVQSMLKLGRAQGVAMAAAIARDVPIFEYAPLKIKMSITGNGRAAKEQVAYMVQRLLNVKNANWALDTSDALALAVCHLTVRRFAALTAK